MRRTVAVAAAWTCTAGLLLVGCKGGTPSTHGSPTPSASASPSPDVSHTARIAALLTAAARRLDGTSFQFEGGSGIVRMAGSYDTARRVGDISGSFGVGSGEVRVIGSELYVKGLADPPAVWLRVDADRLAPGNALTTVVSPTAGTGYLAVIDSATQVGPHRYSGTLDVDLLAARAARSDRAEALLMLLGGVPVGATFEARTDSAGRLTELSITVPDPDSPASTTLSTRYYDFGTPVSVTRPPAAQVDDAPEQLYAALAPNPVSPSPSPSAR
jgi:hypothetical protein